MSNKYTERITKIRDKFNRHIKIKGNGLTPTFTNQGFGVGDILTTPIEYLASITIGASSCAGIANLIVSKDAKTLEGTLTEIYSSNYSEIIQESLAWSSGATYLYFYGGLTLFYGGFGAIASLITIENYKEKSQ